ncbi:Hsp20/alpha crystallin family protein [Candidatus Nitrosocosmicus sp. T]
MSTKLHVDKKNKETISRRMDTIFENFRDEIESNITWPYNFDLNLPGISEEKSIRKALCDLIDKGDKYQIQLELPGINKKNIDIKAAKNSIEVSAKQSEKMEQKDNNYIYNERSFRSVYRTISLPEEVVQSKITAKLNNGILEIDLPKKVPTVVSNEATKIEIE